MEAWQQFLNGAVTILLANGLAGVVIAIQFFAIRNLYKRVCTLQDARVIDAQAQTTALNASSNALSRISDALMQGKTH